MATQSRAHHLANCYLKAAGVAGVYAERRAESVILFDVLAPATVDRHQRRVVLCAPLTGARRLAHLISLAHSPRTDLGDAERFMAYVAAENGIPIVTHETVIRRAFEAVRRVEKTFADLQHRGELRDLTDEFKRLRAADQGANYADFIAAKKAAMMVAVARAMI